MNKEEQWLLEEKYKGVGSEAFHADLERLKAGEPLAYIIGSIPFLGCTIYLDSKPLIPRTETEFWVEKAIADIQSRRFLEHPQRKYPERGPATESDATGSAVRVLDLCAGSGAIGVAVAKAIPEATVHFAEIDKTHLATIGKNLKENKIDCTRYKVFESDLFKNVTDAYDYILTNPPYIDPALDRTEPSVKNHEPHLALYAEGAGLALIKQIIQDAKKHLNPNGKLYIEHEPEQVDEVHSLGEQNGFSVTTHTDQYKVPRYSILVMAQ